MTTQTHTPSAERVSQAREIVDRVLACEAFSEEYYQRVALRLAERLADRSLWIGIKPIAPSERRHWWTPITSRLAHWKGTLC